MITSSDLATQWSTRFETLFRAQYNQSVIATEAEIRRWCMEATLGDNQGDTLQFDWLGAAPQMREWTDEKRPAGLNKFDWDVKVRDYEASIEIRLNALKDAKGDIYSPRIQEMAENAARLPFNLINDLIVAGTTELCYDGQYFFDNDHSEGDSGTQNNLLDGTGTSLAQITSNFYTAKAALMGFKDDKGEPLFPSDFRPLVVIPNSGTMVERWNTLRAANLVGGGNSNLLQNQFDLLVNPKWTDANDWCMFRLDRPMKPFIRVNRQDPVYRDNFDSKSDDVFKRKIGLASVEARCAMTYGLWQCAVKVVNG